MLYIKVLSSWRRHVIFGLVCVGITNQSTLAQPAPVPPPNYGFLPCSVCLNDDEILTEPGQIVPPGTIDFITENISCITLELQAQTAQFSLQQCASIASSNASSICGCSVPAAPSPVPIVHKEITGLVMIQLVSVQGTDMTPEVVAEYEQELTTFYQVLFNQSIYDARTFVNVTATLLNQTLVLTPSNNSNITRTRQRGLRDRFLQSNDTSNLYLPLNTWVEVTGFVSNSSEHTDASFSQELVNVTNENAEILVDRIQSINDSFFQNLNVITANDQAETEPSALTATVPVSPPVEAPVESPAVAPAAAPAAPTSITGSDDGLSSGAKAGIAIGAVAAAGLAIALVYKSQLEGVNKVDPVKPVKVTSSAGSRYQSRAPESPASSVKTSLNTSTRPPPIVPVKPSSEPGNRTNSLTSSPSSSSLKKSSSLPPSSSIKTSRKMMEVEYKNHRTITAPAGKLGIVIDKSIGGPIVKRVNETSPLFGQLFVGDKVLALNHQSTESMTADSIKTFLMEHADQERIFKVCTPVSTVRTVIAPAGPLGIVIDKNATITNVKETSVLKDNIFVGDKIIKIDDMNADGMTSANISEYLMKNSAKEQRILTVIKLPPPPQMEKVTIIAPSGKLGIVIERTSESGPRIKTINEKSPLYNQLVVGDQIMSIDDQNTENMTSAMVSDYLLKHMEQEERVIVVQRIKKQEIPEVDEKSEEATSVTVDADGSLATAGETRTVVTPAGKLGVVIDRTSIGLVIQKINPGSPLEGQLYVGDRIISIDEVDASSMTTASFQSYMVKTVDSERTLIVTSSSYNIPSLS